MRLETKHLAAYLPYGLKIHTRFGLNVPKNGHVYTVVGIAFKRSGYEFNDILFEVAEKFKKELSHQYFQFKPILRPLSDLTKSINWGLQTYEFTSLFEIGDTDGFIYEFTHGNIKLINELESIALYNSYNDINYLPYPVVQMMLEHHFDIFGLIDAGLAIDINSLDN